MTRQLAAKKNPQPLKCHLQPQKMPQLSSKWSQQYFPRTSPWLLALIHCGRCLAQFQKLWNLPKGNLR